MPRNEPNSGHFGDRPVGEGEKQQLVDRVFEKVAPRYDLMNDLMSAGLHRLWKDAAVAWLAPPRAARAYHVIDVAGGTGDIAFRIADAAGPGAKITVCDISEGMLRQGARKAEERGLAGRVCFTRANAEALPYAKKSFDAYTIAFGIRNVPHIMQALTEAYRVLKPGGRFICLEFSQVDTPFLDGLYDFYSFNAIPLMGRVVAGDAESYRYLVESIRRFPDQRRFASMIEEAGFARVSYRNLSGGIAAMHSAWRV